eukprot:13200397-Alexandrium_andersonii.AAC.1
MQGLGNCHFARSAHSARELHSGTFQASASLGNPGCAKCSAPGPLLRAPSHLPAPVCGAVT